MSFEANFGATADDYARHRHGFPESLFERLASEGLLTSALDVADLGTGTGTMARGWACRGCRVTGIDPAAPMLEQARALDAAAGVTVSYREARAEETGLPSAGFDVVTAGQCWHWFERRRAGGEVLRILRPGGRLLIAHYDWLPLPGNVVADTEGLIERHNPSWTMGGGNGIYPAWFTDLGVAGFEEIASFSYDCDAIYTPEAWRGRIRASGGVGGSLSAEAVELFDSELARLLSERHPAERLAIPHRVFAVWGCAPR